MSRDIPVTVDTGAGPRDALLHWSAASTVRDLRSTLQLAPQGPRLYADGIPLPAAQVLADSPLQPGVRLTVEPMSADTSAAGQLLCQVTGAGAGRSVAVTSGGVTLGRSRDATLPLTDREASRLHCRVDPGPDGVTVVDLGSTNGTWLDERPVGTEPVEWPTGAVLRIGSTYLTRAFLEATGPGISGVGGEPAVFHRAPRTVRPPAAGPQQLGHLDPGALPPHPDKQRSKAPIGVMALLTPIITAGVLYLITMKIQSALYGLVGAVAVVGGALETWRRSRKEGKQNLVTRTTSLEQFRREVVEASDADARLRWQLHPPPAECLARAEAPGAQLWERRPTDPDFLHLLTAVGDVPWAAPVAAMPHDEDARAVVRELATRRGGPVPVDLGPGATLSLALPRADALPAAQSLLCQAMSLHGPADLRVVLVLDQAATGAGDWAWLRWAPHLRGADGLPLVVRGDVDGDVDSALAPLLAPESGLPDTRHVLVVLDGAGLLAAASPTLRRALVGERPGAGGQQQPFPRASVLVVGGRASEVSSAVLGPGTTPGLLAQRDISAGTTATNLVAVTLSAADAERCARALAGHTDPLLIDPSAGVPDLVPLHDLLPVALGRGTEEVAAKVTARWAAAGRRSLRVPVGASAAGVFDLDVVTQGPHALIGGTSGSGKSELLKTFCASLAATYPPELCVFGLFDFKGGTSLQELRALPHCVGLVADTDLLEAERAMRYLQSELLRREELLFEAKVGDIADYPGVLPRLVVVIDEFQILSERLPDLLASVIDVTKRGRSLGVHLVFATQSPTSVRNYAELKKNTRLRVSLRLEDAQDSIALMEVPDAASFPTVGRALARLGAGTLRLFQSGWTGADALATDGGEVSLRPFALLPPAATAAPVRPAAVERTELSAVIDGIRSAYAARQAAGDAGPAAEIWPAALPPDLHREDLPPVEGLLLGLGDNPEGTRDDRSPVLAWDLAAGNLIVHGAVGSGTTSTLLALAVGVAERWGADDAHLLALDFGGGELAPLAALPHCGGNVITAWELERQAAAIAGLKRTVLGRARLSAADRAAEPRVFVLVDNLTTLAQTYSSGRLRQGQAMLDDLSAVAQQGPNVGVLLAATVPGTAVPHAIGATITQRVVLALADLRSYGDLELTVTDVPRRPGRGILRNGRDAVDLQVALPAAGLEKALTELAAAPPAVRRPPSAVRELPAVVGPGDLAGAVAVDAHEMRLPLGLAAGSVEPAVVSLGAAGRLLLYGPARCGKTTVLIRTLRLVREQLGREVGVYVVAQPGSELLTAGADRSASSDVETSLLIEAASADPRPTLLLVDDVGKVGPALGTLLEHQPAGLRLVAAGRVDQLRSPEYGTPAYQLRTVEQRLVIQPDPASGDPVTGRFFDYGAVERATGRGFLVTVDGDTVVQT